MDRYRRESACFSAHAKLPLDIPPCEGYKVVDISLIVNIQTGVIEDASITLLTQMSKEKL